MFRLPIPDSWQLFETVCQRLWQELWCDPVARKNGRLGQPQAGVDIFGRLYGSYLFGGVQCKDRDGRLGAALTQDEFDEACVNAVEFNPTLSEFVVATTAARDEGIQEHVRVRDQEHHFPFRLEVWSWNDIEPELLCRQDILKEFNWPLALELPCEMAMAPFSPKGKISAFLNRDDVRAAFDDAQRRALVQLINELVENAFRHGKAATVSMRLDHRGLSLRDDGRLFNPCEGLDAKKATRTEYLGSLVFDYFRRTYNETMPLEYGVREGLNEIRIRVDGKTVPAPCQEIFVDPLSIFARANGADLARQVAVPADCKEVVVVLKNWDFVSGIHQFLFALDEVLPPAVRILVSCPRSDLVVHFQQMVSDRMRFVPR